MGRREAIGGGHQGQGARRGGGATGVWSDDAEGVASRGAASRGKGKALKARLCSALLWSSPAAVALARRLTDGRHETFVLRAPCMRVRAQVMHSQPAGSARPWRV